MDYSSILSLNNNFDQDHILDINYIPLAKMRIVSSRSCVLYQLYQVINQLHYY